ncbi:MAG: FtsX-like permease family protein, partial [Melioribacteraceae bacterium]
FQFSYDQYHKNKNNIYRLATAKFAKVADLWAPGLKDNFPEVENYVRFQFYGEVLIENGDKKFYEPGGFYADSSLFDVFSFPLLEGNEKTALVNPNSIVITKDFSQKFFGDENPIGKTLVFNQKDGKQNFLVTGLLNNVPPNSHFHFSFLVSQSTNKAMWLNNWTWSQFYTYLLFKDNIDINDFSKRAEVWLNEKINDENLHYAVNLQPLTDIHLHSNLQREIEANQDISSVYLFAVIGLMILLVAVINFINLKTAHAVNRAKEVGVRKSIGAERKQLISQFISESVIFSLVSFLISLICVQILPPALNNHFDIQIETDLFKNINIVLGLFFISLLTGLLSGIYPAVILSRFKPATVLKGSSKLSGKSGLRKAMVVFQFGVSAFLIISSLVIYKQMSFINQKDLGFNKDQIITFDIRSNELRENYKAFKNILLSNPDISNVSITANLPGGGDWGMSYKAEGINDADIPNARMLVVDYDFIDTYGIDIINGRKFNKEFSTDTSVYIINETAAKVLGWDNPLNKKISFPVLHRDWANVIGVAKDFHFRSLHEVIEPLILFIPPDFWYSSFSIKLKPGNLNSTISFIEETWKKFDPEHPFTFTFLDENFGNLYLADKRDMELITYATIVAIFIACLGLYALISFTLTQKTKEIGIRKVLGAKITDIIFLVSKEFFVLLVIANLIAWPAAFYFLQDWLESFAYRTDINFMIFAFGSLAGSVIAFSVILYKVIKAASSNTVESLRSE